MCPLLYDRQLSRRPEGSKPSQLPNLLSTLKIISAISNIYLITSEKIDQNNPTTYIFPTLLLLAGIYLDQIDGKMAERLDSVTKFGAKLDILGDIAVATGALGLIMTIAN